MTRIADLLTDVAGVALPRTVRVTEVDHLGPAFTRVTLSAESLRRPTWVPGAKVQLRLPPGPMTVRTYTPIRWDNERGEVDLLAFAHGTGPASQWFGRVTAGTTGQIFGPRRSINLTDLRRPVVFAGDESSVALACALRTVTDEVSYLFEARDPDALREVLAGLGLAGSATVVATASDHQPLLRRALDASAGPPYTLIVTGDAATVHALRRDSRGWPHRPAALVGKAYWAEGRTGLD